MEKKYNIPAKECRAEILVKKSRFITTLAHTDTELKAKEFLERIRSEFSDATHNCWAYNAGPPGDTAKIGMSDDGEPHGTAGKPILNNLIHSDVGEITAVVTRYYGGTKLGTGGLVRAYSGSVKHAFEQLELIQKRNLKKYVIETDYKFHDSIKRTLESFRGIIEKEDFTERIRLTVSLPEEHMNKIRTELSDLSGGAVHIIHK